MCKIFGQLAKNLNKNCYSSQKKNVILIFHRNFWGSSTKVISKIEKISSQFLVSLFFFFCLLFTQWYSCLVWEFCYFANVFTLYDSFFFVFIYCLCGCVIYVFYIFSICMSVIVAFQRCNISFTYISKIISFFLNSRYFNSRTFVWCF